MSNMFCLHTLPWYCKASILVYDGIKCWQQRNTQPDVSTSLDVHSTTLWFFTTQTILAFVLLGPSLCMSVADRVHTNAFVSEMLLLLSSYMLLIGAMRSGAVSAEHACFCLQFCSCYFFFCFWKAVSCNRKLLLASSVIRWCSVLSMIFFPVMFSHLPRDCMHLSPHVLLFLFSGECSACLCTIASYAMNGTESLLDTLYYRFVDFL